jgi:hypothetical protein
MDFILIFIKTDLLYFLAIKIVQHVMTQEMRMIVIVSHVLEVDILMMKLQQIVYMMILVVEKVVLNVIKLKWDIIIKKL